MKATINLLFLWIIIGVGHAAEPVGTPLPMALESSGGSGIFPLSEGYRGVLRTVARTGVAAQLDGLHDVEPGEFTHFSYAHRGLGSLFEPAFTIMIGLGSGGYGRSAIHFKALPTLERLKDFQRIAEFEDVFGKSRDLGDGWGSLRALHSSRHWTGFTMQRDGTLRVVHVFLFTLHCDGFSTIEGARFCEGVFTPTGAPPVLESE